MTHQINTVVSFVISVAHRDKVSFSFTILRLCIYKPPPFYFMLNICSWRSWCPVFALRMEKRTLSLVLSLLLFIPLFHGGTTEAAGTQDGSEEWGYVEVRPSKQFRHRNFSSVFVFWQKCECSWISWFFFYTEAHMFWWLYRSPNRVEDPSKPWPIILWLQGGPVSICIFIK